MNARRWLGWRWSLIAPFRSGHGKRRAALRLELLETRCTPSALVPLPEPSDTVLQSQLAQVPLLFEANRGHAVEPVQFLAEGGGYSVYLAADQTVLALSPNAAEDLPAILHMNLLGGNPLAVGVGSDAAGQSSYLTGTDAAEWRSAVPAFARVVFGDVYPGIDLAYYGNQKRVEYDFIVSAGADPGLPALAFGGADAVSLDAHGNLDIGLAGRQVIVQAPMAYQMVNGTRQDVVCRFALQPDETVRFAVGSYDVTRPLVIDPVLSYSDFLGGAWDEWGRGIAVDATGAIYFVGDTGSDQSTLYLTSNAFDKTYNGPPPGPLYGTGDILVRKLANGFIYSTYLGGTGNDFATGLAIDAAGNAYITGNTMSSNFPVISAYQSSYGGGGSGGHGDAFLTKLNASGTALLFSTYLGGSGEDQANGIALDGVGNVYVAGQTTSTNLPVFNAYQATLTDNTGVIPTDAFVAKFTTSGSPVYLTYFRSSDTWVTVGRGIAADSFGNAYVTGTGKVPTTPGAYNTTAGQSFVSKFNPDGSGLVYSTYLPGCAATAIALDSLGNAYVTGSVSVFGIPIEGGGVVSSFVTTAGAAQTTYGGGETDAFITKLNATGTGLIYSTFLGGNAQEIGAQAIAVEPLSGSAFVTGGTFSTNFPTVNAVQASKGGGYEDAFVTRLSPAGDRFLFSTYLGGSSEDRGQALFVDARGNVFVTGGTMSGDFPTSPHDTKMGLWDAFVVKIATPPNHAPVLSTTAVFKLPTIAEDTANPTGTLISALVGTAITDRDPQALKGIAVIGTTGTGTWQFSSDHGANWIGFGSVTAAQALLLPDDDMIRFVPDANANGTATFSFRAWDQTTGTSEGIADLHLLASVGGTTAFSAAARKAAISVTPVNDAPVLDPTTTPTLTTPEDRRIQAAVATLLGSSVSDVDAGARKGIAVIGIGAGGAWQYSFNGGMTFQNFGTLSASAARLLRSTDLVRFVPARDYNGTSTITFHSWDRTTGAAGGTTDITAIGIGGSTAFSSSEATAILTVTPVNDAPVLLTGRPLLPAVSVNDTNPAGASVDALFAAYIHDVDAGAAKGVAIIGLGGTINGAWQFSTDGSHFIPVPSVSASRALLLDGSDWIRFVPNTGYTMVTSASVLPGITLRAWDETSGTAGLPANIVAVGGSTAFSLATQTARVCANNAPVLTPSAPTLPPIASNKTFVSTVASLLGTSVQDIGTGTRLGIAVTGLTTSAGGAWQFSTNGGTTFVNFGASVESAARLLKATDMVRYLPLSGSPGTASITYRAWDQTTSLPGRVVDLTLAGVLDSHGAFSSASDMATLGVT